MTYSVNYWGSKPGTNDDCWTGKDFESKDEAIAAFNASEREVIQNYHVNSAWIELDGPDIHLERRNPDYYDDTSPDDDWRREAQMQAGMAFGCAGYNQFEGQ